MSVMFESKSLKPEVKISDEFTLCCRDCHEPLVDIIVTDADLMVDGEKLQQKIQAECCYCEGGFSEIKEIVGELRRSGHIKTDSDGNKIDKTYVEDITMQDEVILIKVLVAPETTFYDKNGIKTHNYNEAVAKKIYNSTIDKSKFFIMMCHSGFNAGKFYDPSTLMNDGALINSIDRPTNKYVYSYVNVTEEIFRHYKNSLTKRSRSSYNKAMRLYNDRRF